MGVAAAAPEGAIRPRLIPESEIERLADQTMALYLCDPWRAALNQEKHYWHRCDSFEQAKWRRVRKTIRRRLAEGA